MSKINVTIDSQILFSHRHLAVKMIIIYLKATLNSIKRMIYEEVPLKTVPPATIVKTN